jgi:hypothetical protein
MKQRKGSMLNVVKPQAVEWNGGGPAKRKGTSRAVAHGRVQPWDSSLELIKISAGVIPSGTLDELGLRIGRTAANLEHFGEPVGSGR